MLLLREFLVKNANGDDEKIMIYKITMSSKEPHYRSKKSFCNFERNKMEKIINENF